MEESHLQSGKDTNPWKASQRRTIAQCKKEIDGKGDQISHARER
jgi:hypothetical protein